MEDKLNKNEWVVKPISLKRARELVTKLHYSKGATNTGVYTHGLFRKEKSLYESDCLGVAWWLPPTKNCAVATYPEGDWKKVLSLTRLAKESKVDLKSPSVPEMDPRREVIPETGFCLKIDAIPSS